MRTVYFAIASRGGRTRDCRSERVPSFRADFVPYLFFAISRNPRVFTEAELLSRRALTRQPHMWTAAPGKHFFDVSNDLVDCAHMSGLLARSIFPLALMKSDNLDPYHIRELCAHEVWRVVPDLRWRPCRSSRLIALAKLEPVYLPCELRVPATDGFLTPSQTSRCGSIRRSSSSPRESGPACLRAPP